MTSRYDDPLNFINLNVGMAREQLALTLWGKNLPDEQELQTPFLTENGDPALPAALTSGHNSGLQYGVTIDYTF